MGERSMSGIWIRSQDKGDLVFVQNISAYNNKVVNFHMDDYSTLGFYSSQERCLEILDEIQEFIIISIHESQQIEKYHTIYQMPEK
jgi:hypothetical protein